MLNFKVVLTKYYKLPQLKEKIGGKFELLFCIKISKASLDEVHRDKMVGTTKIQAFCGAEWAAKKVSVLEKSFVLIPL